MTGSVRRDTAENGETGKGETRRWYYVSVLRPATLPIVLHVCSMDGYDCQLKATYDVSSIIHFTFFFLFLLEYFHKGAKTI